VTPENNFDPAETSGGVTLLSDVMDRAPPRKTVTKRPQRKTGTGVGVLYSSIMADAHDHKPDPDAVAIGELFRQARGDCASLPNRPSTPDLVTTTPVVTKSEADCEFGNDTVGFIRVRKRAVSMSFDLVRAVRVNSKPRHVFVLGLGSQKHGDSWTLHFWEVALIRMIRHGLTAEQRARIVADMVRKGARLPTAAQCRHYRAIFPAQFGEVTRWVEMMAAN
jgi:hypothetical protein